MRPRDTAYISLSYHASICIRGCDNIALINSRKLTCHITSPLLRTPSINAVAFCPLLFLPLACAPFHQPCARHLSYCALRN